MHPQAPIYGACLYPTALPICAVSGIEVLHFNLKQRRIGRIQGDIDYAWRAHVGGSSNKLPVEQVCGYVDVVNICGEISFKDAASKR